MSHTIRTRPLGIIGLVAALAAVVALQGSQAQDSKPVSEVLTPEKERTLQPKAIFKECADCPEMVVVPAGEFMMGSPENEADRLSTEGPRHKVRIPTAFAVGRFEESVGPGLGTRQAAGDRHQLGGRSAICSLALEANRQSVSVALGGRMGIRSACRH
jgi:hypothetical protein